MVKAYSNTYYIKIYHIPYEFKGAYDYVVYELTSASFTIRKEIDMPSTASIRITPPLLNNVVKYSSMGLSEIVSIDLSSEIKTGDFVEIYINYKCDKDGKYTNKTILEFAGFIESISTSRTIAGLEWSLDISAIGIEGLLNLMPFLIDPALIAFSANITFKKELISDYLLYHISQLIYSESPYIIYAPLLVKLILACAFSEPPNIVNIMGFSRIEENIPIMGVLRRQLGLLKALQYRLNFDVGWASNNNQYEGIPDNYVLLSGELYGGEVFKSAYSVLTYAVMPPINEIIYDYHITDEKVKSLNIRFWKKPLVRLAAPKSGYYFSEIALREDITTSIEDNEILNEEQHETIGAIGSVFSINSIFLSREALSNILKVFYGISPKVLERYGIRNNGLNLYSLHSNILKLYGYEVSSLEKVDSKSIAIGENTLKNLSEIIGNNTTFSSNSDLVRHILWVYNDLPNTKEAVLSIYNSIGAYLESQKAAKNALDTLASVFYGDWVSRYMLYNEILDRLITSTISIYYNPDIRIGQNIVINRTRQFGLELSNSKKELYRVKAIEISGNFNKQKGYIIHETITLIDGFPLEWFAQEVPSAGSTIKTEPVKISRYSKYIQENIEMLPASEMEIPPIMLVLAAGHTPNQKGASNTRYTVGTFGDIELHILEEYYLCRAFVEEVYKDIYNRNKPYLWLVNATREDSTYSRSRWYLKVLKEQIDIYKSLYNKYPEYTLLLEFHLNSYNETPKMRKKPSGWIILGSNAEKDLTFTDTYFKWRRALLHCMEYALEVNLNYNRWKLGYTVPQDIGNDNLGSFTQILKQEKFPTDLKFFYLKDGKVVPYYLDKAEPTRKLLYDAAFVFEMGFIKNKDDLEVFFEILTSTQEPKYAWQHVETTLFGKYVYYNYVKPKDKAVYWVADAIINSIELAFLRSKQ